MTLGATEPPAQPGAYIRAKTVPLLKAVQLPRTGDNFCRLISEHAAAEGQEG
jgi:hypothetical protein